MIKNCKILEITREVMDNFYANPSAGKAEMVDYIIVDREVVVEFFRSELWTAAMILISHVGNKGIIIR